MEKLDWKKNNANKNDSRFVKTSSDLSGYLSNICREILRATRHDKQWNFFSPLPPNPK